MSADGRYQLFVNGNPVGHGPARCSPAAQCVDSYDVGDALREGRNVVAALVHSYGRATSWYELPRGEHARAFGCGGFFFQMDIRCVEGERSLDSDATWSYRVADGWQRDAPSGSLGFLEYFDARLAIVDWAGIGYDDSRWEMAEVLRIPGFNFSADIVPFPIMVRRDIPHAREQLLRTATLVRCAEVVEQPRAEVAEQQEAEELLVPISCAVEDFDELLSANGTARVTTKTGRAAVAVLDFGETVTGRIRLRVDGAAGSVIDFSYAERTLSDGRVRLSAGIPGFDVRPAHRYVLREGEQVYEPFDWAGFRFAQFTFRNCERPLRIREIALRETGYPVDLRGRFECSDPLLNQIWNAGVRTLSRCMHDGYIDCPSREQRQWLGDAYVETMVNYVTFGDLPLAGRLLRQAAEAQRADGLTPVAVPGDFAQMDFFQIPDFCLYWIMSIARYVEYSGDLEIIGELYPAVVKAVRWFDRHVGDDDLLTDLPHWAFVDWAELDKRGSGTVLNAQYVAALRVVSELSRQLGHSRDERCFAERAARVSDAINLHLWDERRGVYADARVNGKLSRRVSQHANAATIAFGVAPRERWQAIFASILDDERVHLTRLRDRAPPEAAFDEERHVVMAQPFFAHHLHRALARAGMIDALLANVRRRWGMMLEHGTTFWETWQLDEMSSLCHGYSSTPTYDLSTEILGIRPLAPGFRRFSIAPSFTDLEWARGVVPTPHGAIEVSWERRHGEVELGVCVPANTEGEIAASGGILGPGMHSARVAHRRDDQ